MPSPLVIVGGLAIVGLGVLMGSSSSSSSSGEQKTASKIAPEEAIKQAQACLKKLGLPVEETGKMDQKTKDAVAFLQKNLLGVPVTGQIDAATAEFICKQKALPTGVPGMPASVKTSASNMMTNAADEIGRASTFGVRNWA